MMLGTDGLPSVEEAASGTGPGPARGQAPGPGSGVNNEVDLDLEPLACVTCRSRKLKCDRAKPACVRCARFKSECVYPESRRKPAFKRRNVKELEERLGE